jgi:hypothetical protein
MRAKRNSSKAPMKAKKVDLNIDCVAMVRKIRDANYLKTKNMSIEEKVAYYNDQGRKAQEEMFAHKAASKAK